MAAFKSARPFYLLGLGFSLPFVSFGVISFLAVKERIKKKTAKRISLLLVLCLGFMMTLLFFFVSVLSATSETNAYKDYKRLLRATGYPDNPLLTVFPASVPANAHDVEFRYTPRLLQGGEVWSLGYKTDISELIGREENFRSKAVWIGKPSDPAAEENGIHTVLTDDFTVYLLYRKPYKENNWNHGSISMAAVSIEKQKLLFYAEDW